MTDPNLPRYLARAMNVRGIGVYDPALPPEREVFTWLSRKHQYRSVGFPPSLMTHPSVDLTSYKTFETVGYPIEAIDAFADRIETAASPWVLETLIVSSCYLAPLFIHRPALEAFDDFARWQLLSDRDLPEDQVMRHVRIAGYGMLDFHADLAASAYAALVDRDLRHEADDRDDRARDDGEERFWRVLGDDRGSTWVGGYFDILPALLGEEGRHADFVADNPDVAIALGIVGGIAIDPPYD